MYIEYDRDQWRVCSSSGRIYEQVGIANQAKDSRVTTEFRRASKFKPTWLVRVADMQAVRGSTVSGPYWALSYSWNQSGELIPKGNEEYDRIDNGEHVIVDYSGTICHQRGGWDGKDKPVTLYDRHTVYTTYGKFEKLVQQICKDFGIEYIWYDQVCINQGDHEAKIQEIKQMHDIYGNALCTLALIPELHIDQPYRSNGNPDGYPNVGVLPKSQWCQRMWTLEEAYVSKDILFVGRNVHVWADASYIWKASETIPGVLEPECSLFQAKKWKACTALWYAKKRTSSKAHDRVFAFINIFPEMKEFITFSYKQPFRELMIQFYSHLAQSDTSILLFGALLPFDDSDDLPYRTSVSHREEMMKMSFPFEELGISYQQSMSSTQDICTRYSRSRMPLRASNRQEIMVAPYSRHKQYQSEVYGLPSWTGERGVHITQYRFENVRSSLPRDYTVTEDHMSFMSSYIVAHMQPDIKAVQLFCHYSSPQKPLEPYTWGNSVRVLPEDEALSFVSISDDSYREYGKSLGAIGLKPTHYLPLKKDTFNVVNTMTEPSHYGGLLSLTEECSECLILLDVVRNDPVRFGYHVFPVVRMHEDHCESIGVCFLRSALFLAPYEKPSRSFLIK